MLIAARKKTKTAKIQIRRLEAENVSLAKTVGWLESKIVQLSAENDLLEQKAKQVVANETVLNEAIKQCEDHSARLTSENSCLLENNKCLKESNDILKITVEHRIKVLANILQSMAGDHDTSNTHLIHMKERVDRLEKECEKLRKENSELRSLPVSVDVIHMKERMDNLIRECEKLRKENNELKSSQSGSPGTMKKLVNVVSSKTEVTAQCQVSDNFQQSLALASLPMQQPAVANSGKSHLFIIKLCCS